VASRGGKETIGKGKEADLVKKGGGAGWLLAGAVTEKQGWEGETGEGRVNPRGKRRMTARGPEVGTGQTEGVRSQGAHGAGGKLKSVTNEDDKGGG